MVKLGNSWDEILKDEFASEYYHELREFLKREYSTRTIYPPMHDIFNAFRYTPYEKVKVVILGQDPYVREGQAHGLAFSVREGVPSPPSLVNIFKLLDIDLGVKHESGCLTDWAERGVLLLNTALTVRKGEPNSHKGKGWEVFADRVISLLNERKEPIVFMLWGNNARSKKKLITLSHHLVLEAVHPSPLSCYDGYFECGHFKKAQEFLGEKIFE